MLLLLLPISCGFSSNTDFQQRQFDSPEQFLIDLDSEIVAVVRVRDVQTRWIIIEHGDHVPFNLVLCEMEENIRSGVKWPSGVSNLVAQIGYTNMMIAPIAPPPVEGQRFIIWGSPIDEDEKSLKDLGASFLAYPRGFFLIRGKGMNEYIYWNKKSFSLKHIRRHVKKSVIFPLDKIQDPQKRIEIAQRRLKKGNIGETKSFIEGLMLNIRDPEGQAANVEDLIEAEPSDDIAGYGNYKRSPFGLWYESLSILRDMGRDTSYQQLIAEALQSLLSVSRKHIQLAVALVLAELKDDTGKKVLLEALNSEKFDLSKAPGGDLSLPGRLKYDYSSTVASSYALGLIGDRSGLQLSDVEEKLAAAEGLSNHPDYVLIKELKIIAEGLNNEVNQLMSSGKLTEPREKGDFTERYPKTWIKTHYLLARLGHDDSLKLLLEAFKTDNATYPETESPALPKPMIAKWTCTPTGWLSLKAAIYKSDSNMTKLLERLRLLMENDPAWSSPPFLLLRVFLEDETAIIREEEPSANGEKIKTKIAQLLSSPDPQKRAEGLAGAGYNQIDTHFQKVLETALKGAGVEKMAAIYSLGFYNRVIPKDVLIRLSSEGNLDIRLMGLELATRKEPAPFAPLALDLLNLLTEMQMDSSNRMAQFERSRKLRHLTRILTRFSRSSIPQAIIQGLEDPKLEARLCIVRALGMGGNPIAVSHLVPLKEDPNPRIREEVRRALEFLGPGD